MKILYPLILIMSFLSSAYGRQCFYGPESIPPGQVIYHATTSPMCGKQPFVLFTAISESGFSMCDGFGQAIPEGYYIMHKERSPGCGCIEKTIFRGTVTCVKYRNIMRIRKR